MAAEVVPAANHDAILRAVGLNVNDPNAQALLLVCERYGLDPLLKHMVLIQQRPYVTRDGYLHIAHASKQLDGIETLDEGETQSHWWAKVAVYRKDMTHPFAYKGRYPKSGGNKNYGPEMAIKCAEVAALRRAFNVTGAGAADERWDTDDEHVVVPASGSGPVKMGTASTAVSPGPENNAEGFPPDSAAADVGASPPEPPTSAAPSYWSPGVASIEKALSRCSALAAIGVDIYKARTQHKPKLPELRKLRDEVQWHEWGKLLNDLEVKADKEAEKAGAAT